MFVCQRMNQLGVIEYGGGSLFSSSVVSVVEAVLSVFDFISLFIDKLLGYVDELGRDDDSLFNVNALFVTPPLAVCV
jgi:hypothetical protein